MIVQDFIRQTRSQQIKDQALAIGFMSCGISEATFLEKEAPRLTSWLENGYQGKMAWMENHFDKRLDPRLLVDGAKSVISVALNYFPEEELPSTEADYKLSKYAYGTDYHFVLKDKMNQLVEFMEMQFGAINQRVFVDSAPVMDKAWAERSGLGWIGKNTNLIHPKAGSFFFLGEIICDLELTPDGPIRDYCGTCTKCVDACPTDAIHAPYQVDGSKCISYLTIELKEEIPNDFKGKMENWVFGCDICQDVCPWNRFSKPTPHTEFKLNPILKDFKKVDWENLTSETFAKAFQKSAVKRTKLTGLARNIKFVQFPQNDDLSHIYTS